MLGQAHETLISRWIAETPGSKRQGFWSDLKDLCESQMVETDYGGLEPAELLEVYRAFVLPGAKDITGDDKVRPDAFVIQPEKQTVVIFEAVISSDVTTAKWHRLFRLGSAFDGDGWFLRMVVDRCGARSNYTICEMSERLAWRSHPPELPASLMSDDYIGEMISAYDRSQSTRCSS